MIFFLFDEIYLEYVDRINNSSALTRFAYAEALRSTGNADDSALAKKLLQDVLALDPRAANDKSFRASAKAVGIQLADASRP